MAKRAVRKITGKRGSGSNASRTKNTAKKPIESYDHKDKKRANNPPVGLVTPATDPDAGQKQTYQYDPHLDPQLVWAGKAEHTSFEVPTVSLHVHERIDPRTIIEATRRRDSNGGDGQMLLFEQPEQNPPLREAIEFYKHAHNWTNRMIAGDSLLVMNSLLEKEGMAGKVQMVYIDPPYGIRYKSNFQPFVNKRAVSETDRDDELSGEPETIRAFRDTWEVGIHSYLAYLRDRLLLSRSLLHPSGSCFVQISDENLHLVRSLLDEVFGPQCLVVTIPVKKKGSQKSALMDPVNDYLLWYSKTPRTESGQQSIRFRSLFQKRALDSDTLATFKFVELPEGSVFPISALPDPDGVVRDYRIHPKRLVRDYPDFRLFKSENITSGGERKNQSLPFEHQGRTYTPGTGNCWKTTVQTEDDALPGMNRLAIAGRILAGKGQLRYKGYLDDFGYEVMSNWWDGLGGAANPIYIVQTNTEIVKRCILMTTDPGDLVLDPTCGSGTTAYVAEQWGRRWITCDTSRVSIALAKQRLMTPVFDYYDLSHPEEGVGSGFKYKTVPHIKLGSIANNPEIKEGMSRNKADAAIAKYADQETLYDQPFVDNKRARVSGPFTVEAVPAPAVRSIAEVTAGRPSDPNRPDEHRDEGAAERAGAGKGPLPDGRGSECTTASVADSSVGRSGETLRQDEWRDELLKCGIRGKKKQHIHFSRVETLPGTRWLHADAEEVVDSGQGIVNSGKKGTEPKLSTNHDSLSTRIVISFGPEHAPLEQRQVEQALEEAQLLKPKPKMVVFASFQFDPEAAKDIDETNWPGITLLKVQMNTDLLTDDLKKKRASNESFWMIGQPDVQVRKVKDGDDKGKIRVEVCGFDYYNPVDGKIESGDTSKIAMWMLDTDYDGRSLYPSQVFFPMAGAKDGWARLAKNLKAEIDEERIEAYRGTISLPFEPGDHKRVAVKIIDDRGIESLKIVEVG